jgi:hypothetical protein
VASRYFGGLFVLVLIAAVLGQYSMAALFFAGFILLLPARRALADVAEEVVVIAAAGAAGAAGAAPPAGDGTLRADNTRERM